MAKQIITTTDPVLRKEAAGKSRVFRFDEKGDNSSTGSGSSSSSGDFDYNGFATVLSGLGAAGQGIFGGLGSFFSGLNNKSTTTTNINEERKLFSFSFVELRTLGIVAAVVVVVIALAVIFKK